MEKMPPSVMPLQASVEGLEGFQRALDDLQPLEEKRMTLNVSARQRLVSKPRMTLLWFFKYRVEINWSLDCHFSKADK